ncbi:hypothetical protein BCR34DRAFT_603649 [Clohesyomyces aquaticus]|uniref:Uncharacterized protein n=1 Tax=Clohesyomyces aquaticus TaxID=1231657 RepID=A0A1Y1ZDA2_9PLEO|nr:hypothetical protein BCR34DRAFT_603649 [Clohesyomyces aquaticus]
MAASLEHQYHDPSLAPPVSVDDHGHDTPVPNAHPLHSQIAHPSDNHHPLPIPGLLPDDQELASASILATLSDSRPPTSPGENDQDMDDDLGGGISLLDPAQEPVQSHPNMSAPESDSDESPAVELPEVSMGPIHQFPTPEYLLQMGQSFVDAHGVLPNMAFSVPSHVDFSSIVDQLVGIGFATVVAQSDMDSLGVQPDYSNGENPNAQDRESFVDISTFLDRYAARPKERIAIGLDAIDQPAIITRDDLCGDGCDFQGINWSLLNMTRSTVRTKRNAFETTRLRNRLGHEQQNIPPGIPKGDDLFSFRRMNTAHRAKISHFQLRNLLASTSRNDIFCSSGESVIRTDASGADADCVIDLSRAKSHGRPVLISTLAAADHFLIAGGFYGEYALTNLASTYGSPTNIGRAIPDTHAVASPITNHISMFSSRSNYTPQAVLCSNDNRLRILDCETNTITDSFLYTKPINCSATSPNGRLRVVVGDFNETLITNAETGQPFETLSTHADDVFACDWADDGIHVATAAQDRRIVVWDARNWSQPLSVMGSELSIPRSVKFSPLGSGPRVLVSAESDDYINIINAQTFESRQVFDFFGKIAGMSFCPDGSSLFVANSDSKFGGLMEFERCGWGEYRECGRGRYDTPVDWLDDDAMDEGLSVVSTWQERSRRGVGVGCLAV